MLHVNIHTKGCKDMQQKGKSMRLKNIGKKVATLTLAAAMAVGGSLSVFAATGFTVSDPSLVYDNGGYSVTGSMTYNSSGSSTSYYVRVEVTGIARVNGQSKMYTKSNTGYGKAAATTDQISVKPFYIENVGSYNTGVGSFINVDTKYIYP